MRSKEAQVDDSAQVSCMPSLSNFIWDTLLGQRISEPDTVLSRMPEKYRDLFETRDGKLKLSETVAPSSTATPTIATIGELVKLHFEFDDDDSVHFRNPWHIKARSVLSMWSALPQDLKKDAHICTVGPMGINGYGIAYHLGAGSYNEYGLGFRSKRAGKKQDEPLKNWLGGASIKHLLQGSSTRER